MRDPSVIWAESLHHASYDTHTPSTLPTGDLSVESSVYEWLIDDDIRELQGSLEEVNRHMLNRLVEHNPFVAAVFISKGAKSHRVCGNALTKPFFGQLDPLLHFELFCSPSNIRKIHEDSSNCFFC